MTNSRPAGKSKGRHAADPAPSAVTGLPDPAADDDMPQATSNADAGPPDDVEELRQEIEQTRGELGETVEQLVAKADVKAQAQAKVSELAGRAKGKASRVRAQAADGAGSVRDQVASKAAAVSQKTKSVGTIVTQQLPERVAATAAPVRKATPEPVRQAVVKAADNVRKRPELVAVAAALLTVGYLVARRWRKR